MMNEPSGFPKESTLPPPDNTTRTQVGPDGYPVLTNEQAVGNISWANKPANTEDAMDLDGLLDASIAENASGQQGSGGNENTGTTVTTDQAPRPRLINKLQERNDDAVAQRLLEEDGTVVAEQEETEPASVTVDLGNGEKLEIKDTPVPPEGLKAIDLQIDKQLPSFAVALIEKYIAEPLSVPDQNLRLALKILVRHNEIHLDNQIDPPMDGATPAVRELIINTYIAEMKIYQQTLQEQIDAKAGEDLPQEEIQEVLDSVEAATDVAEAVQVTDETTGEKVMQITDMKGNVWIVGLAALSIFLLIAKPDTFAHMMRIIKKIDDAHNPEKAKNDRLKSMAYLLKAAKEPEWFIDNLKDMNKEDLRETFDKWFKTTPTYMKELLTDGTINGKLIIKDDVREKMFFTYNDENSFPRKVSNLLTQYDRLNINKEFKASSNQLARVK